jgi:FkbM family methyltransferase
MIKFFRKEIARLLRGFARRLEPHAHQMQHGHACTDPFFDCLQRLGFKPELIIDIGANRGNWTRTALRYFPDALYILFEPQGELLKGSDLDLDPKIQIFAMGVGPKTATMKLSKHTRDDSFSFALSEQEAADQGREQIEAPVVALDEFLAKEGLPQPSILKIDAEGWDLEVLKGAESAVSYAEIVLLEAAVLNKFFPNTLLQVVAEMGKRGFVVFDVTDLNRTARDNALWLVEIAFVKAGGFLDCKVDSYQ